jgi:type IV pilus assembly protein PilW
MTAGPVPERAGWPRQRGMTLVELLIAMALALLVVLFATAGFVGSKQLFTADAEAQAVEDTLRFAGFVVKGIVRQAGYADYTPDHTGADGEVALPGAGAPSDDPSELHIVGARNTRVGATDESHGTNNSRGVNGSDSLLVRFFGRSRAGGDATEPDGTMVDCMGFPQAGPMPGTQASADRAWSFFYIAKAADGEPELYCKYRSEKDGSFRAEPLARGIEVFNVVFGHDGDGDGVPERWLDAAQLEAGAPSGDKVAAEWRKVVGLRIGMVARSDRPGAWPRLSDEALYPLGSTFPGAGFKPPADGRLRRVATFTVMLRNAVAGPVP